MPKAPLKKKPPKKHGPASKKRGAQKAPPKKSAPRKRARMSGGELTRTEMLLMERMDQLDEADPRYKVLEAALAFKASWVLLAEHLTDVYSAKQYLLWGYPTFATYCTEEVRVTSVTAKKLVRSYQWLDEEAPELMPRDGEGRFAPQREVPDYATVSVLADARRELQKERVPKDAYLALKQAALDGDRTASELRKDLKEAIPEDLRRKPELEKAKNLRKALTAAVKLIDSLREWGDDDELVVQAEDLRDAILARVPREEEPAQAA